MKKLSLTVLALCLLALVPLRTALAGDGLYPDVPRAKARFSETQECVEPIADMRRNHMEYILHQRDETMHRGIRTRQYSLEECINCHVSDAPDAPRYNSGEQHFCNSCHTFAAVRIDCFQCHADRPVSTGKADVSSAIPQQPLPQADSDARVIEQLQTLVSGSSHNE